MKHGNLKPPKFQILLNLVITFLYVSKSDFHSYAFQHQTFHIYNSFSPFFLPAQRTQIYDQLTIFDPRQGQLPKPREIHFFYGDPIGTHSNRSIPNFNLGLKQKPHNQSPLSNHLSIVLTRPCPHLLTWPLLSRSRDFSPFPRACIPLLCAPPLMPLPRMFRWLALNLPLWYGGFCTRVVSTRWKVLSSSSWKYAYWLPEPNWDAYLSGNCDDDNQNNNDQSTNDDSNNYTIIIR